MKTHCFLPFRSALACIGALAAFSSTFAGTIPANRMPASGWTNQVGVPGGIPTNYTQFCNVRQSIPGSSLTAKGDGVTDDSPALQAALSLCPNNQFIYLPAGTYRLNSSISKQGANYYDNVQRPYSIIMRGAGPSATKLMFYGTGSAISLLPNGGYTARTMAITGGNTRGSTQLTLGSIDPFMATNIYVVINRLNSEATSGHEAGYMTNTASQIVKVTALNTSSKTITISPALNDSYPSDYVSLAISAPLRCGLEDFYIENKTNSGGHSLHIEAGQESWIKNVESSKASKWHIHLQSCARMEVRDCYLHDGWDGGGDSIYGVGLFQFCSNNLIENNIALHCRHSFILEYGGQGNVFGYNYSKDPINENQLNTDYLMGDIITHGGDPRYNLWEGNVAATIRFDCVLGGSTSNTAFRNRLQRKGLATTYVGCFGSDIQRWNYNENLVGNVYEAAPSRYGSGFRRWGSNQDDQSSIDSQSQATALLDGEVDLAAGTTTWASSDHTLPNSYYLSSKPSFFGSAAWPLIGPSELTSTSIPAVTRLASLLGTVTPPLAPSNPQVRSVP